MLGTRPETLGKFAIILGAALFAVLMDTLLIPVGPTVGPIIVGVMTLLALALLVVGLVKKG
ncbi:MAG: hypothetical protein JRN57_01105 [Nitrososphaerota archaeon]|nr:hypothetical protein [Nitrososphaerota archaeon]MDG7010693.1 hypothetical protein [Nitrososphaerota archaeon]